MACKDFKITEYKNLEIQFEFNNILTTEWFVFDISTRSNQDHAGIHFNFEFMKLIFFNISLYDGRHID